jgi:iron(III) transport system substrate-binding protein
MNRSLRRFIAASVASLVLAACSTASDTSAPDTTPEDGSLAGETLVVYSGRSESLVDELFTQFTAQTGIALDVRYGDSGELASLILTEGKASPADVYFSQDAGALGAVSEVGLLAELPPDVLEQVDERFRSTSGQWVATSGRVRVVVYNPTLVATPPAGIDDLLDPQWKGKIGYAPTNASWQSFVTALRVIRGEDAARTWLEGFAANEPVPYEKNGVVRDAVNAGEVSLGLVNHYYLYEKIAAEGADSVVAKNHYFLNGDVGGLVNVAGVGVVASSAKQTAALEFVKFLLSAQGQQYFVDRTFEYPMAAGIDAYFELPKFDALNPPAIDLSDLSSIEATQQLLEEVGLLTR